MNHLAQFFVRVADKFDFRRLAAMMLARSQSRNRKGHATPQAARLKLGDDCVPVCCVLWDISDEGASLTAAHNICDLPESLSLTFDDGEKRNCRVIWQKGLFLNVAFANCRKYPETAAVKKWARRP